MLRSTDQLDVSQNNNNNNNRNVAGEQGLFDARKFDRVAWRIFTQRHGLTLPVDTIDYLRSLLRPDLREADVITSLDQMAIEFKARRQSQPEDTLLTVKELQSLLEASEKLVQRLDNMTDGSIPRGSNFVQTVDRNVWPRWEWDGISRRFISRLVPFTQLVDVAEGPETKIGLFKRRFELTRQRAALEFQSIDENNFKFTTARSIKGQRGGEEKTLFGFLIQRTEGGEELTIYLVDGDDQIRLAFTDLLEPSNIPVFFTEGSLVAVTGVPDGLQFQVHKVLPPPLRNPSVERTTIELPIKLQALKVLEPHYQGAGLVIVSDLWLDCLRTVSHFDGLLGQLEARTGSIPLALVLQGSFLSKSPPRTTSPLTYLVKFFTNLANIIAKHPLVVQQSRIFIQPSSSDPLVIPWWPATGWSSGSPLMEPFREQGIDATFLSNPARIYFFTKEIVLIRKDISSLFLETEIPHLRQSQVGGKSPFETILRQGHCSPVPLEALPIAWSMDHLLDVFPPPDVLVVSEKSVGGAEDCNGCLCVNSGSFAMSNYSYSLIFPLNRHVELKQLS